MLSFRSFTWSGALCLGALLSQSIRAEDKPPVAPVAPVAPANPVAAPIQATPEQLAEWVKNLSNEDFKVRSEAEQKLRGSGAAAIPELEKALASNDPEVKTRVVRIIGSLKATPIIQKMSDVLAKSQSIESDMTVKMTMRGMDALMTGHLKSLTDGRRFQMVLTMNLQGMKLTSRCTGDGTYMWNEVDMPSQNGAGGKMVQKMPLSMIEQVGGGSGQTNPIQAIRDLGDKFDFTGYSEAKVDDEDCYVLEGTMRPEALEKKIKAIADINGPEAGEQARGQLSQMTKTKVYVAMRDMITRRNEMLDVSGNLIMRMDLKNIKLDQKLDESEFQYTPPPGVQVMDVEQLMKNAKALKLKHDAMMKDDAAEPPGPPRPPKALRPPEPVAPPAPPEPPKP